MIISQLVKTLQARGIKVQGVEHETDDTDAAIIINDKVSVQVGGNYVCVVIESGEGENLQWEHSEDTSNMTNLFYLIQLALECGTFAKPAVPA